MVETKRLHLSPLRLLGPVLVDVVDEVGRGRLEATPGLDAGQLVLQPRERLDVLGRGLDADELVERHLAVVLEQRVGARLDRDVDRVPGRFHLGEVGRERRPLLEGAPRTGLELDPVEERVDGGEVVPAGPGHPRPLGSVVEGVEVAADLLAPDLRLGGRLPHRERPRLGALRLEGRDGPLPLRDGVEVVLGRLLRRPGVLGRVELDEPHGCHLARRSLPYGGEDDLPLLPAHLRAYGVQFGLQDAPEASPELGRDLGVRALRDGVSRPFGVERRHPLGDHPPAGGLERLPAGQREDELGARLEAEVRRHLVGRQAGFVGDDLAEPAPLLVRQGRVLHGLGRELVVLQVDERVVEPLPGHQPGPGVLGLVGVQLGRDFLLDADPLLLDILPHRLQGLGEERLLHRVDAVVPHRLQPPVLGRGEDAALHLAVLRHGEPGHPGALVDLLVGGKEAGEDLAGLVVELDVEPDHRPVDHDHPVLEGPERGLELVRRRLALGEILLEGAGELLLGVDGPGAARDAGELLERGEVDLTLRVPCRRVGAQHLDEGVAALVQEGGEVRLAGQRDAEERASVVEGDGAADAGRVGEGLLEEC